jgi:hypothetical protein
MVGGDPVLGGTTRVKSTIIPVSLAFPGYVDANGNALRVDISPIVPLITRSPNYVSTPYGTGTTQFEDAVQRASFWNVMGPDWHTLLDEPRVQRPIELEIPLDPATAEAYQFPDGVIATLIDQNFFLSQLNTILQLADIHWNELAILITPNILLVKDGRFTALGFHTALDAENPEANELPPQPAVGAARFVQTFAWASWFDSEIVGDHNSGVLPMSHEIAETINDPFDDNVVDGWAYPGPGSCYFDLETGDPVNYFAPFPDFPVTIDGYTYHPQTEALLPWFSREVPSSAFQGAYSYPNETALTSPSQPCAPDAGN